MNWMNKSVRRILHNKRHTNPNNSSVWSTDRPSTSLYDSDHNIFADRCIYSTLTLLLQSPAFWWPSRSLSFTAGGNGGRRRSIILVRVAVAVFHRIVRIQILALSLWLKWINLCLEIVSKPRFHIFDFFLGRSAAIAREHGRVGVWNRQSRMMLNRGAYLDFVFVLFLSLCGWCALAGFGWGISSRRTWRSRSRHSLKLLSLMKSGIECFGVVAYVACNECTVHRLWDGM